LQPFRTASATKSNARATGTSRCPSDRSDATSASPGRARVEHVFGAIEQMGGKLLRTIGQERANV